MIDDGSAVERYSSDSKLAEAVLYVSSRLAERDDTYRGAVKLNKILWRADFESFRATGRAVTGADYQRLAEGPAPVRLLPVRTLLERQGAAHRERFDVGASRAEEVLVADRPADLEILRSADVDALDEAIEYFFGKSGSQVSKISHRESAGWQSVRDGEVIPYETALVDTATVAFPSGTEERVQSLVSAHEASLDRSE